MIEFIFDTDGIGDDILAMLAMCSFPDRAALRAVTTYGRRIGAIRRAQILRSVLAHIPGGGEIPVIPGSDVPLMREPLIGCMHCDQAIDSYCSKHPPIASSDDHSYAAHHLVEMARSNPGRYSLVCTGPLTNIALALRMDPRFRKNLKDVVIMGGTWKEPGNSAAQAEANFYNDAEAAHIVFSMMDDVVVVGLDVTLQTEVTVNDVLNLGDSTLCSLVKQIVESCCTSHRLRGEEAVMPLHDVLAFFALLDPSVVETHKTSLDVETKSTLSYGSMFMDDAESKRNHQWCTAVDNDLVTRYFGHVLEELHGK